MIIIENQDEIFLDGGDIINQRGQHCLNRWGLGCLKHSQDDSADIFLNLVK